jgi:hypothetical protein
MMFYSCLAHVINLATQAFISTYSKAPHFDPKDPEAHEPTTRDEVGLVRAIMVKVHIKPCGVVSVNADGCPGTIIVKEKRNVENSPVQSRYCKTSSACS